MFWEDCQSYPSDYPRSSSLSKNSACWCTSLKCLYTNVCNYGEHVWWVKNLCTDAGLWSYWDWGNMVGWCPWLVLRWKDSLFRNDNIWFSKGNFYHPDICWRDNTGGHKQSSRFLKCINDNFLLQDEPKRRGGLLVLISPTRKNLLGYEDQRQPWLQWP